MWSNVTHRFWHWIYKLRKIQLLHDKKVLINRFLLFKFCYNCLFSENKILNTFRQILKSVNLINSTIKSKKKGTVIKRAGTSPTLHYGSGVYQARHFVRTPELRLKQAKRKIHEYFIFFFNPHDTSGEATMRRSQARRTRALHVEYVVGQASEGESASIKLTASCIRVRKLYCHFLFYTQVGNCAVPSRSPAANEFDSCLTFSFFTIM